MKNKVCQLHHKNHSLSSGTSQALSMLSVCLQNEKECEKRVTCSECWHEHEGRITLKELKQRLGRLEKEPQKQVKKHLNVAGSIIQKFKFIEEFKMKICVAEEIVMKQFHELLNKTEEIVAEETANRRHIQALKNEIPNFQNVQQFSKIRLNQKGDIYLYNERLHYLQKQQQDCLHKINKRYSQIKDYCIKIIEVIVNCDDEDDEFEEEESLPVVSKFYQRNRDYILHWHQNGKNQKHIGIQTEGLNQNNMKMKNREMFEMEKSVRKLKKENEQLLQENKTLREEMEEVKKILSKSTWKTPIKKSQNSTTHSEQPTKRNY